MHYLHVKHDCMAISNPPFFNFIRMYTKFPWSKFGSNMDNIPLSKCYITVMNVNKTRTDVKEDLKRTPLIYKLLIISSFSFQRSMQSLSSGVSLNQSSMNQPISYNQQKSRDSQGSSLQGQGQVLRSSRSFPGQSINAPLNEVYEDPAPEFRQEVLDPQGLIQTPVPSKDQQAQQDQVSKDKNWKTPQACACVFFVCFKTKLEKIESTVHHVTFRTSVSSTTWLASLAKKPQTTQVIVGFCIPLPYV